MWEKRGMMNRLHELCANSFVQRELPARMIGFVDVFHALLIDVSVDLRRRDVSMTEQFLNHPQIGTTF
jgi:hypothetical protein